MKRIPLASMHTINRIEYLLEQAEQAIREEQDERGAPVELPEQIRQRLLTLGASTVDLVLWVRRVDDQNVPGVVEWRLTEVESGVEAEAVSPRGCCERYFAGG